MVITTKFVHFYDRSLLNNLAIFEEPLLYGAISELPDPLAIELVVLVHALVNGAVGVRDLAHTVQLVVLEHALQHLPFDCDCASLSVQVVVLEMTLTELLLVNVVAEPVELVETVFVDHLACKSKLLVLVMVNHKGAPDLRDLVELGSVLDADQLSDTLDPKVILKLELALLVELTEIELAGL